MFRCAIALPPALLTPPRLILLGQDGVLNRPEKVPRKSRASILRTRLGRLAALAVATSNAASTVFIASRRRGLWWWLWSGGCALKRLSPRHMSRSSTIVERVVYIAVTPMYLWHSARFSLHCLFPLADCVQLAV